MGCVTNEVWALCLPCPLAMASGCEHGLPLFHLWIEG
jgi:hypothetical protein